MDTLRCPRDRSGDSSRRQGQSPGNTKFKVMGGGAVVMGRAPGGDGEGDFTFPSTALLSVPDLLSIQSCPPSGHTQFPQSNWKVNPGTVLPPSAPDPNSQLSPIHFSFLISHQMPDYTHYKNP